MSDYEISRDRLAMMWERHDPVPADLVEKVLIAIATEDLDAEYEMLHFVERSRELAGARGPGESITITFSGGPVSLLLRVSPLGNRECRVDGWVTPARAMKLSVSQKTKTWDALVDAFGRFELPKLPTGLTRLWLRSDEPGNDAGGLFATPTFEL
jgi:hypothetical protein